jgi:hypothetical protein
MDPKAHRPTSASARSSDARRSVVSRLREAARLGVFAVISLAVAAGLAVAKEKGIETPGVDSTTFVDHDAHPPIKEPAPHEANLYRDYVRYGVVQPFADALDLPGAILDIAGAENEAVNINDFDEVPNSSWFTNRNHLRAVPVEDILNGPANGRRPRAPWTIESMKTAGVNPGFNIKDAAGKRWVVKLDPIRYPQIGSGADVITSRILYAAGYFVPHDVAVSFKRKDLKIDPELAAGKDGKPPLTDADVDRVLDHTGRPTDGRYFAVASLFIEGKPIGHMQMEHRRPDDPNDWYNHMRRRELRGLGILAAWLNSWDAKDQQSLEVFSAEDSLGSVHHYLLDFSSTLGAAAGGPKRLKEAYEFAFDPGWIARRYVTLGFVNEPWRKASQETKIPSVGNLDADDFHPDDFRPAMPQLAFQEMSAADAYWGSKLVASFSDAQLAAAVEAAGYEDPRATSYITTALEKRRDVIARTWFGRVAPIDFLRVDRGQLRFHDLAVDLGLDPPRSYRVRIESLKGGGAHEESLLLSSPVLDLTRLSAKLQAVRLTMAIDGKDALPTTVELSKKEGTWHVTRVRHGQ